MNESALLDKISTRLSPKRLKHTIAVKDEAVKLAKNYGYENIENVITAALLHDIGRAYDKETMNALVEKYHLNYIYLNNISLAHSKVGAELIKDEFYVNNKDIIQAVSYHTTGKANMTLLEKIIYIADIIEPNKYFDEMDELRALSYKNIDEACLLALNLSIKHVIEKKEYLHEDTVRARNYLLREKEKIWSTKKMQ